MKHYRSSIPKEAGERVVAHCLSGPKFKSEFRLSSKLVGVRQFYETGECHIESPFKDGKVDGREDIFERSGVVHFSAPYRNGRAHGIAKQFHQGHLIGTYSMKDGTGIDLWRVAYPNGRARLTEARYLCEGRWHGYEWWINPDQRSVFQECHYFQDQRHGVERHWRITGSGLRRGYPKHWIHGKQVSKLQYLSAAKKDPSLPPFREKDNRPARTFPPEIAKHLNPPVRPLSDKRIAKRASPPPTSKRNKHDRP